MIQLIILCRLLPLNMYRILDIKLEAGGSVIMEPVYRTEICLFRDIRGSEKTCDFRSAVKRKLVVYVPFPKTNPRCECV